VTYARSDREIRFFADVERPWPDRDTVCLALGGTFALWVPRTDLDAIARAVADPEIKKRAEEIVYRELARLVAGEELGDVMRLLLSVWLERRMKGNAKGRPDSSLKHVAVVNAFIDAFRTEPERKLESIYTELANRFQVSRRQILQILEPARGPKRTRGKSSRKSPSAKNPPL